MTKNINPIFFRPAFLGKSPDVKSPNWENFTNEIESNYPDMKISDVIISSYENEENVIGEGREKIVFRIPKIENYVGAYLKHAPESEYDNEFKDFVFSESEYYFGEPVGGNGKFIVMKKIPGKEYSIHDWSKKYLNSQSGKRPINKEDAQEFLKQIKALADFPIESYIDIQKQVKYLTDKDIRIDSINPNNILVDEETQSIHIVDLIKQSPTYSAIKPEINCCFDMSNLLTDSLLNEKYSDALTGDEEKELTESTKQVIFKCKEAGKIAGLSDDINIARRYYGIVQGIRQKAGRTDSNFADIYDDYIEKYADVFKS